MFLRMVRLRFGAPSADTTTAVNAASPDTVNAWVDKLLTADTLDEVFAEASDEK